MGKRGDGGGGRRRSGRKAGRTDQALPLPQVPSHSEVDILAIVVIDHWWPKVKHQARKVDMVHVFTTHW